MAHPLFRSFGLLAHADYRRMWAIGGLGGGARWLEFVAVAIYAYELTRSPQLVALLSVMRMAPYVALGLVVGALADMYDRRRLMLGSLVIMAVVAAVMAVLTALDLAEYGAVAVATMFSGAFWTIDMPVRRQLMVDAVTKEQMAAGLGLDNATMYLTRVVGPLIGGITYALVGMTGIFTLICAAYLLCLVLASRFGGGQPTVAVAPVAKGGLLGKILPPRELLTNRRFQVILGMTTVYNLWCFPFVSMVPVIAQKDFGLSPFHVGMLAACDGIGGIVGALVVGAAMTERTMFRYHYFGTFAYVLLIGVMSLHLVVGPTAALLVLLGVTAACFSATQYALVYLSAPPEMRGRATGMLSLFIGSSLVGFYHTGYLFERLGTVDAMRLMAAEGLIALLFLGAVWWRIPQQAGGR